MAAIAAHYQIKAISTVYLSYSSQIIFSHCIRHLYVSVKDQINNMKAVLSELPAKTFQMTCLRDSSISSI
ncbi:hypothetical protein NDU88_003701 [Pleurodeles waltl]|uniref:Uncharacterized protein n=1 Tax=Pleurodeles waltl TaxID=8319 RepID=A0AAV7W623_PLEWA|nr:hypothetical protein NDU88_003701 [Pleurodeles waltl]